MLWQLQSETAVVDYTTTLQEVCLPAIEVYKYNSTSHPVVVVVC